MTDLNERKNILSLLLVHPSVASIKQGNIHPFPFLSVVWILGVNFSIIVTCMSDKQWPLRLKWAPVAWSNFRFLTYPLCCPNLVANDFSLSPMYCILQWRQEMQYIMLQVWQFTEFSISWMYFEASNLIVFPWSM